MSVVIIKANRLLKTKEFCDWYNHFLDQKDLGLILLPPGFTATYIPDDVEIRMEDEDGREK